MAKDLEEGVYAFLAKDFFVSLPGSMLYHGRLIQGMWDQRRHIPNVHTVRVGEKTT
jgi:hypothetical protein